MNSCCKSTNGARQSAAPEQTETTANQTVRSERVFRPTVDIIETVDQFTLVADVPGGDAQHVDASFEDGVLTIRAGVPARHPEDTRWLVREYGVGAWERTFRIGEGVDPSRIAAVCKDGVLTLTLPKAEHVRARKIEVRNN